MGLGVGGGGVKVGEKWKCGFGFERMGLEG